MVPDFFGAIIFGRFQCSPGWPLYPYGRFVRFGSFHLRNFFVENMSCVQQKVIIMKFFWAIQFQPQIFEKKKILTKSGCFGLKNSLLWALEIF